MTSTSAVTVEIYDFNRDAWTVCEFLGSKPGATQVKAPNGQTYWFANTVVRFSSR